MITRQFQDPVSSTFTYLLASRAGGNAFLIDPVLEQIDQYLQMITALQLRLHTVFDTHVHADHITASGVIQQKTGFMIAMKKHTKALGNIKRLEDGEQLHIDEHLITCLHTPGHSDVSMCFLLEDRIFTGDLLFINGSGRTDFQHGNAQDSFKSITEKVFTLRDDILIYPGHDYNGRMVSTVGEEKRFNPRLAGKSEAEYIATMNGLNLPKPKLIDVAVPANLRCGLLDKQTS